MAASRRVRAGAVGMVLLALSGLQPEVARGQAAISIASSADLRFGELVAGGTPGSVTISPAGVRTASGGVAAIGGNYGAASFTVSGEPNYIYVIELPTSITLTSGANTMTVDTFTSNPSGTGTLDGTGNQTLTVGATLQVGANQANGNYTGTFDVLVYYQ